MTNGAGDGDLIPMQTARQWWTSRRLGAVGLGANSRYCHRRSNLEHGKVATGRPRVLLIGRDAAVRSTVDVALSREGLEVRSKSRQPGLREFTDDVEAFHPDVVILDVDLAVARDGYAMVRLLRQLDLRSILLADTLDERLVALRAGVHDCLVKPLSMQELATRTRGLLARSRKTSGPARRVADLVLDEAAHTVSRGGNAVDLTRTEFRLLSALARHPAQVLSKGQLLGQVWGSGDYDTNLVEVHICTLRKKLEAHGPRLVHTVRSVGYVLRP